MKAACVLLCLALAHGISGNIFKQQAQRVDDLDVQPQNLQDQREYQKFSKQLVKEQEYLEKIAQQQRYLNQQAEAQQFRVQQVQGQKQRSLVNQGQKQQQQTSQDQKYQQQTSQEQQYQQQTSQEQQYQQQTSQEQQNQDQTNQARKYRYQPINEQRKRHVVQAQGESQQAQSAQNQQSEQVYRQQQYEQLSSQDSNEQASTHRRPHHHHHHHNNDKHHQYSSSSESSQESNERRFNNKQQTPRDGNQRWNSLHSGSVMTKEHKTMADDVIMWRGLQMAIGPNSPVQNEEDIERIFGDAQKAMKHIPEEEKARFHQVYEQVKQESNEDAELNATQLAQKYQFPVEEHTIKTEDGYELTVFRIPPRSQIRDVQKRPVAFLMHDILGSADDWLLMGPSKSLAYLLSVAGYDVWLGNARGNKYSRRHVSKHPAVTDFWQFNNDQIALQDLPAMINYALETTKQEKLYYIGVGQGTTAFFALTATRSEFNNKIIMMYALSPMVYMTNVRSPLFRMISPTSKFQQRLQKQLGNGAFTPSKDLIRTVGGDMCEKEIGCNQVCSNANFVMAGVNVDGLDAKLAPVVLKHLPAGTSTQVIIQYGQGVASHEFRRYDYGSQINKQVYGQQEPPKYNMAEVQAPVALYYSEEDWLAHPTDVARLQKELPNVQETYKVPEEHFSHMDFQFSSKAPEIVYNRLIESMENQQSNN